MSQTNLACRFFYLCAAMVLVDSAFAEDDGDSPVELLKNGAANSLDGWRISQCTFDKEVGRTELGSLKVHSVARGGHVYQIVELKENPPSRLRFSVHVKTRDLKSYASVREFLWSYRIA